MLAQIIRRVPRGRLCHQQRPRRADNKRRVHRRRFRAPREDGACSCIEPCPRRRTKTARTRHPSHRAPRATPGFSARAKSGTTTPAASEDQPSPGGRSTTPRQPHQHVASHQRREPLSRPRGPREQRHDFPGDDYLGSGTSACPTPSTSHSRTLIMQPTAQTMHHRPRRYTKMGLVPQEPPPQCKQHGIGTPRGSSFRPTWRTIKRTSEVSRRRRRSHRQTTEGAQGLRGYDGEIRPQQRVSDREERPTSDRGCQSARHIQFAYQRTTADSSVLRERT